tara:strand:- start:7689 stop:8591 length:903 start_codon:yes stop_codon:yes gene_type:complete
MGELFKLGFGNRNRTVKNLLSWSIDRLTEAKIDSPRLDSEILLAHALACRREKVFMEPDRKIEIDPWRKYLTLLERRLSREPIHYIIGMKEFWSLDFKIVSGVLIPRPETEFLVQLLLELNPDRLVPFQILDIGTGSGALTVAAAKEFPKSQISSMDICSTSLDITRHNAEAHNVLNRIQILEADVFGDIFFQALGTFHFILANPPYIASGDLEKLMPEVRDFEPRHALDGGSDGLHFYRRIIPLSRNKLKPGGYLIMEIGDGQLSIVSRLIKDYFSDSGFLSDFSGKPRVLFARKEIHG